MNLHLPIRDLMNKRFVAIPPETTVLEIEHLFVTQNLEHLPVMGSDGRLVGMVSKTDLKKLNQWVGFKAITGHYRSLPSSRAAEIMTPDVIIILPDDTFEHVCDVFIRRSFNALPVVDPESLRLVGTVSMIDLLKYAVAESFDGRHKPTADFYQSL